MVSERMQRRIDRLLDQAEAAADEQRWTDVRRVAREVLALNPDDTDAPALLRAAEAGLEELGGDSVARPSAGTAAVAAPSHPDSFAGGRYRVERFLGEGGKKRVFLAHDTTLDREVAFGQFRTEGMDTSGRARVTQEAQAMGRVGAHPNLVNIYDIGEESGAPFIVQEYVSGGSVADLIGDEPPPLEQTLRLATDVCSALSFIHEQSLVHRDIKPSNVFLTEEGTAKVGDFGLAVGLDRTRITMQGGMIGTPSYMPPEQALAGDVTPQSDLYSLGAMLYELVTGRPPFVGDDPTSVISQHINTPPVAPSWHSEHCPPDLEELILRCLAKSPDDRPESAAEVREALARVDPEARSVRHSGSGANPLDRLARGVFVGREGELERLRLAFDEAFSGRGSLVMLVGESGMGKTRTAQELQTYARMRGASVLWGRAREAAGAPPYWPWIQVGNDWTASRSDEEVQALADDMPPEAPSELSRIFRWLRDQVPAPEEVGDPDVARFRLFEAYASYVRAMAESQPVVLVLDDLHWADQPTLSLLEHLAQELSRTRVLVVATYRDTELARTHPLSKSLANLNREPGFERIVLRGLSRAECAEYIRTISREAPAPAVFERIYEETEGQPFFLSEVVNLMVQEGTLATESLADVVIPDGVREALGRRLDGISEETNTLLRTAAVIGREFTFDLLELVELQSEEDPLDLLGEAIDARIVEELPQPGRYRFTHALMHETLLDELSNSRRRQLHGRFGEALEERWGARSEERATRLAGHFVEAASLSPRHAQQALRYTRLAAEQAEAQADWADAARRYDQCLALLADSTLEARVDEAELLVGAGRCHRNANEQPVGWRRLKRAMDLFRERADGIGLAVATLEALQIEAPSASRVPLATAALELLGDAEPILEARVLGRLLAKSGWSLDRSEVARRRERAATLAERHDLDDVRAMLQVHAGWEAGEAGSYEVAAVAFVGAHKAFDALSLPRDAAEGQMQAIAHLTLAGRIGDARQAAEDGLAYARRYHLPFAEENAAGFLAALLLGLCEFDALTTLLQEQARASSYVVHGIGVVWAIQRGDAEQFRDALPSDDVVGGVPEQLAQIYALRARVALRCGERDAARGHLDGMREQLQRGGGMREVGGFKLQTMALQIAGEAVLELDDDGEYRRAVFEFFKTSDDVAFLTPGGTSGRELFARYALALDEFSVAEHEFAETLAWAEREGAHVIAGQCHQGLAEVALQREEDTEAMNHLDAASKIFDQNDARLYLDQVIAKKLEIQGLASGRASSPDGSIFDASIDVLAETLLAERPDLASQTAPDGTVTILFSDIEGSTKLNVELGDDRWMELLGEHNRLVRKAIAEHRGYEVKTEGDAFMVAFQSARSALRCAIDVQRAMKARNERAERAIRVRVGLHTGEPVREGSSEAADFYGTHVVMASRIVSQATAGEVLVSSLLHELVASSGEFSLTAREPVAFKGLDGEHITYALRWD